jgi:Lipin/Ned1/Smp2 multi-domain protein middle domain
VEGAIGGPKFMDSDFEDSKTPDKYATQCICGGIIFNFACCPFRLFSDLALSLCGPLDLSNPPSEEVFSQATISYAELRQNPALLETPALVVRINGKLRTWKDAAPEVMSLLLFQQPLGPGQEDGTGKLSDEAISSGNAEHEASTESNVVEEPPRYSWFSWRRSGSVSKKSDLSPQANAASGNKLIRLCFLLENCTFLAEIAQFFAILKQFN